MCTNLACAIVISCGFERIECVAQRGGLLGADAADERHQCRMPGSGGIGLTERVDHEAGDEVFARMGGHVLVRTVVADLGDEVLLGQAL